MTSPPPSAMERVLFNLHHRLCTQVLRKSTARTRSILEHALLVWAVGCFGLLLMAHVSFVYRQPITTIHSSPSSLSLSQKYKIPSTCLSNLPGFVKAGADVTHLSILDDDESASFVFVEVPETPTSKNETCGSSSALSMSRTVFSYSPVKGYLLLSQETCRDRNLTVQHVAVSKRDVQCFGEPFLQQIVHRLTGPETVMMNWVLGLMNDHDQARQLQQQGLFVYNPRTDTITDLEQEFRLTTTEQYFYADYSFYYTRRPVYRQFHQQSPHHYQLPFSPPWHRQFLSKLAVVIKTSFLFFTTTTLISFTLRETQDRMLDFTHQLQSRVRLRQSVWSLVVTHLLENLVFVPQMIGLCFFLTEFYYGDKFLAFLVLSLVWLCEVFSVVTLRSAQGMHFFPRIFFLLFSLFHYYLFSFPFGFSYTALTSAVLFMAHSMLFFWHRYELPAVAHGHVSLNNPRANGNATLHAPPQPASIPVLSNSDRRSNGQGALDVQAPNISLSPRVQQHQYTIVRQPSQTSVSNNGSRQAGGSSVVFHHGSTDEDDRDESYMFFMNGEVVMHRRPPSSASLRSGISSMHNDDNSEQLHQSDSVGQGEEQDSVGSVNSLNEAIETSALQAIMEVSMRIDESSRGVNDTPRVENLSRRFADEDDPSVVPDFPDPDTDETRD